MADQSLIRGQAAVSGARAAKGMAFRTGLAESLQQNLTNVAQAYELREQKIRDGEAMANANLLSYDPNNNLPPKYQDLIRQKTEEANNKINEIGKDIGISNTAKNAAMIKIVRDAENDIKGYVDYVNLEMDSMKLVKKIADPNIGQDISSTLSNEVIDIVNKVAGGDYTLDNNNNYIFEGDSKIYNKNEIKDLVDQYSNSIYDVNAVKQAKFSLIEAAAKSKSIQEYNSGVDARLKLYNPNNPKDQASLKKELATIYGYTAEQLQQIEKEGGDYVGALKEELYDIGKEFVPKPVLKVAPGAEAFQAITNLTNRYITEGRLAGENSLLKGKKIDNKEVRKVTDLGDGKFEIKLEERLTGEGIETTTLNLDILNKDDRRKIDDAFAAENYSGKALGDYKNFYLQNIDSIEMPEREKFESTNTNTTSKVTDYPDFIKNASDKPITASEAKKFIGKGGNESIGNDIIMTIKNDYEGVYSEKNIREAAWDNNAQGTDAEGRFIGKQQFEAGSLKSETKKEKINLLLEITNTTPATKLSKDERDDLSDKDRKDLKKFGIVTQIAGVTKKDLAILDYMREVGFKTKLEYEQALAAQFE